ncbi:hypothetical protein [Rathayibacter iranicus]|nr:hypothetical protein [Rathayibacter iranicus]PWJ59721.1 hypothetical protein B0H03_1303 [Rathayibacter iranicus NCPPB 2253 = VKM Ac-1602]
MNSLQDPYVNDMPTDPELLSDLGRVAWAAARLHFGVRDAIGRHLGAPTDAPFKTTLGGAIKQLEGLAKSAGRIDQVEWAADVGWPATRSRNAVIHAIVITAEDGRQALVTQDQSAPGRFLVPELRAVTLDLINASMRLTL